MPRQSKKQKRSAWVPVTAVLLALALAGAVLFSAFREKIDRWEYPQRYEAYVEYYAGKYGIDPMILYAFIRTESNFDPAVDSDAGARGLMQITEVTFDWIKTKIAPTEALTFDDLYDPETNIRFGTYFVSYCLKRYDNHLATAAAAYHNGVGAVDTLLAEAQYSSDGITLDRYPYPQMRQYVKKITESYQRYSEIYQATPHNSRLTLTAVRKHLKIKTKNAPQGVQNSNFAQHQKTGGANQDKPDHADKIHHGKVPGGRGLGCSGGRGLRCGAALGRDNLHLGGGLVHLDGGRCFLGAGGRTGRGCGGLRGGGSGVQSAAGGQQCNDGNKKGRTKKAFHRENASLISVFNFYWKRCSNVPS